MGIRGSIPSASGWEHSMHLSNKESLVMRFLNAHPHAMHLADRLNNNLLHTMRGKYENALHDQLFELH